jgi:hypothetical protein
MLCDSALNGLLLRPLVYVIVKKTSMPTFGEHYG